MRRLNHVVKRENRRVPAERPTRRQFAQETAKRRRATMKRYILLIRATLALKRRLKTMAEKRAQQQHGETVHQAQIRYSR